MNLNQLLSLTEQSGVGAVRVGFADEQQTVTLALRSALDSQGPRVDREPVELSLDSLRATGDANRGDGGGRFQEALADYVEAISGRPAGEMDVDLELAPVVEYMLGAGAAEFSLRREGETLAIVRLSRVVGGQTVAYFFAMTVDTIRSNNDDSSAEQDRALYDLSVAFRKTLFEAKQKSPDMPFAFEGELVLPNGPLLCLGGPRDGERVPDAGHFHRFAGQDQVYEKRWFRSAGIDRSFYVHSGTTEAAAAALARAVMTGTTR